MYLDLFHSFHYSFFPLNVPRLYLHHVLYLLSIQITFFNPFSDPLVFFPSFLHLSLPYFSLVPKDCFPRIGFEVKSSSPSPLEKHWTPSGLLLIRPVIQTGFPLVFLSHYFQDFFSFIFNFPQLDYEVSWCEFVWTYPVWDYLGF